MPTAKTQEQLRRLAALSMCADWTKDAAGIVEELKERGDEPCDFRGMKILNPAALSGDERDE